VNKAVQGYLTAELAMKSSPQQQQPQPQQSEMLLSMSVLDSANNHLLVAQHQLSQSKSGQSEPYRLAIVSTSSITALGQPLLQLTAQLTLDNTSTCSFVVADNVAGSEKRLVLIAKNLVQQSNNQYMW
jgi:hypothetical protein